MNVECEKSYFFLLNWLLRWYQPDEREGGGYSWKLLAVMYRPFLQILTLLQTVTDPWLHFYFFMEKAGRSSQTFVTYFNK